MILQSIDACKLFETGFNGLLRLKCAKVTKRRMPPATSGRNFGASASSPPHTTQLSGVFFLVEDRTQHCSLLLASPVSGWQTLAGTVRRWTIPSR